MSVCLLKPKSGAKATPIAEDAFVGQSQSVDEESCGYVDASDDKRPHHWPVGEVVGNT